jgi:hypothetical protein
VKTKKPTIMQLERAIGMKVKDWPGHCHEVSQLVVDSGIVKGHAVYGFYSGPVARSSLFYERRNGAGVMRHGWILLDEDNILDPTRWVFENAKPYVFVTRRHDGHWDEYDEGMNRFKEMRLRPPPSPSDRPETVGYAAKPPRYLLVSKHCDRFLTALLSNGRRKDGRLTEFQLFWLANLPYDILGGWAPEIYAALKVMGLGAFVPIDNVKRARRETA